MTASPYDDAVSALTSHVGDLGSALAIWSARDETRPCPEARRAANDAMDAVDGALAELHRLRTRLLSDIRVSDDATAARADARLARAARDHKLPGQSVPGTPGRALETPGPSEKREADKHPH
jgi:hypothetical protein